MLTAAILVRLLRIRQPGVLLVHWRVLLGVSLLLPFFQPWHRAQLPATPFRAGITSLPQNIPTPIATAPLFPSLPVVAQILGAVILFGIAVRLAMLTLGLLKLRQFRRTSSAVPTDTACATVLGQARILAGTCAEFHLSTKVDSPVTYGLAAPMILLPERFLHLETRFQSAIACHELLHVRRNDWAHHLAEEVLRATFWFHPAVLWLIARIRLAREQVVDLEVVRLTQERKPYLQALLEFTGSRGSVAAIPAPPFLVERQLVERVALMLKEVRMSRTRMIASLSAIACLLAICAVVAVSVFPLKAAPRPVASTLASGVTQETPAASQPVVNADSIWTDTVKKGDMVIAVRGLATIALSDGSEKWIARVALPEEVAADVSTGQSASVDTHDGVVKGHVSSVSSAVISGQRAVEVQLDSPPPQGVGANTQADCVIDVSKLLDVIYVGRPVNVRPGTEGWVRAPIFKISDDGKQADRLTVVFGRVSVNTIQVVQGLKPGDKVILSDMSSYDKFSRVQIKRNGA